MTEGQKRWQQLSGHGPTTAKLVEHLKAGKIGDILADSQLRDICGEPCAPNERGYQHLLTAIKYVTRHHRLLWEREHGAGVIKCLGATETLASMNHDRRIIRRRAERAIVKGSCVDTTTLEPAEAANHLALVAQMGAVAICARSNTTKYLEARPELAQQKPDREMLEKMFS